MRCAPPQRSRARAASRGVCVHRGRCATVQGCEWPGSPCSARSRPAPTTARRRRSATPGASVDETTLCPVVQASADETVVLVRDRGFDLKNKVFQGRIGGCYRIRRRPADQEQGGTFEQQKAALLAGLARKDDECHLEPGVTLTRDAAFEQVAGQRDAWNAAITAGTSPDAPGVAPLVTGEGGFVYHGTAVAGLIAQHNPGVRLVLVSDEFIAAPGDDPPCPTAAVIQRPD